MYKEKRFNYILDELKNKNEVLFSDLSSALQVSEDTIRRDIETLAGKGLLLKIRGGAIPRSLNPLTFKERVGNQQDDKEIIAYKAQSLISSGQTVFMDGGTSVYTLVSLLPADIKLTVITSNTAIISDLSAYAGITLIVLGGKYLRQSETIVGTQAVKMTANFQADLFFMGVCALDTGKGVTASFMEEAELKQAMMEQSNTTIALSTFDKLKTYEPFQVCPIRALDYMITEVDATDDRLKPFWEAGVKVL
jgi:DeoR/GlpR family transcriptional regulator of sugar metabolism